MAFGQTHICKHREVVGSSFKKLPNNMLIKTHDKWEACHALINTWLRDKTIYCGSCDAEYDEKSFPCCDDPVLATNYEHCKAIVEAIKEQKKTLINEYASNKKKNFRSTVKLPRRLYYILDKYYKDHGTKLFENEMEVRQFARKFKQFKVPVKV